MSIFKKNKKESNQTFQQLQQSFNQVMFELGNLYYKKSMFKQELAAIDSHINTLTQKADSMGKDAAAAQKKMQEEVKLKVAEGQPDAPKPE